MSLIALSGPISNAVPTPLAGLRERLREATAQAHARVDARLRTLDLTKLPDYRRFLEINAAALLPLEDSLGGAGIAQLFPDWPERYRSRAILEDLAIVGGELHTLPAPKPLDFAQTLGTMYVLEGSRLGAQFLLRIAERSPDFQVTGATAYLRHGGGQRLWPSFLAMLEMHATKLDDDARAIDGALRAFALFEQAAATA